MPLYAVAKLAIVTIFLRVAGKISTGEIGIMIQIARLGNPENAA